MRHSHIRVSELESTIMISYIMCIFQCWIFQPAANETVRPRACGKKSMRARQAMGRHRAGSGHRRVTNQPREILIDACTSSSKIQIRLPRGDGRGSYNLIWLSPTIPSFWSVASCYIVRYAKLFLTCSLQARLR